MKNLFFAFFYILFFTFSTPPLFSDDNLLKTQHAGSADELIKFIEVAKGQKNDWLKYEKEFHDAKATLLIKQSDEMFDQKIASINEFKSGDLAAFFTKLLNMMVSLHAKNSQEWKKLCDSYRQKAEELYQKHVQQSTPFKKYIQQSKPLVQTIKEAIVGEM